MTTTATNWQHQPEAIALFDAAYAICGHNDAADFPQDIEAKLDVLCNSAWLDGGICPITAWDLYCAERADYRRRALPDFPTRQAMPIGKAA